MQITLLGLGKLGTDLKKTFVKEGHHVLSSQRSPSHKNDTFEWHLHQKLPDAFLDRLVASEYTLITLPPQKESGELLQGLSELFKNHPFLQEQKIFLTNSISVYDENQGEVDEYDQPLSQTDRGKELIELENELLNIHHKLCVLRLGGLFSANRHPVHYLAGKTLKNPRAKLNGVHHLDVARAINFLMEKDLHPKRVNIVWDQHPDKSDFYINAAKQLGLNPPLYEEGREKVLKIVHSQILKETGFQFAYDLTNALT